jgi:dihydrofolate synthase / folylpolyglutamate synthase
MNYEETLDKIHSFTKFGSRLGLERMTVLMELLGNPQDDMRVIHVAGTNGKGSVCRYLATILQEDGYKVGLYTSPYLERFTERIEFDGQEISREDLVTCASEVFDKVNQMMKLGHESPTEFELVTAIGFIYFARKAMDFLVLEVGLGGTGDSTNLIKKPLVSVITSISYDHMEVLGDTLGKIAAEKAGIIKKGCPVVSNVKDPAAARVIREIAQQRGCDFYDAALIQVTDVMKSLDGYTFTPQSDDSIPFQPSENGLQVNGPVQIGMIGMHQVENGVCALSVIEVLKKTGIIRTEAQKVKTAMQRAWQKGRLEILQKDPYIIIDGAHNEAGVQALSQVIREHFNGKNILLVIGMLKDKKVDRLIVEFAEIPGDVVATEPDNPRKLSADDLCDAVTSTGRDCIAVASWSGACDYVEQVKSHYDAVVFAGSLYLVGKVRERFKHEAK